MSYILQKWAAELGVSVDEAAALALKRHPEVAAMPWQEQEVLLQSLERLHESRNVPITLENSEQQYLHYFSDSQPAEKPLTIPKGKDALQDFKHNATAEQLRAYFLAGGE